jgi:hypothetical protein
MPVERQISGWSFANPKIGRFSQYGVFELGNPRLSAVPIIGCAIPIGSSLAKEAEAISILVNSASGRTEHRELVGPLGLEPRTKGFTSAPPFPEGVDYLFTPVGCGTL